MYFREPLCRLQESVSRFVVPSAALGDIQTLKLQIELRRRALRDIEIIRSRLRPFMRSNGTQLRRRMNSRHGNRSQLGGSLRSGRAARSL